MEKKTSFESVMIVLTALMFAVGFLSLSIWIPISCYLTAKQFDAPLSYFLFYPPIVELWIITTIVGLAGLAFLVVYLRRKA